MRSASARAALSTREVKNEKDNWYAHASANRMVKIQSAPLFCMTDGGFLKEAANIALLPFAGSGSEHLPDHYGTMNDRMVMNNP